MASDPPFINDFDLYDDPATATLETTLLVDDENQPQMVKRQEVEVEMPWSPPSRAETLTPLSELEAEDKLGQLQHTTANANASSSSSSNVIAAVSAGTSTRRKSKPKARANTSRFAIHHVRVRGRVTPGQRVRRRGPTLCLNRNHLLFRTDGR
jgi:hypothetical protein